MVYVETLGFVAGILTSGSLIPQVVKSWKTKSTRDVSLGWVITLTIGALLWIIYGSLIGSLPVIFTNVVTFIFTFTILILKIKHG